MADEETPSGATVAYHVQNIPGDPRLSELQAHARALGLRLVIAIIGHDGEMVGPGTKPSRPAGPGRDPDPERERRGRRAPGLEVASHV